MLLLEINVKLTSENCKQSPGRCSSDLHFKGLQKQVSRLLTGQNTPFKAKIGKTKEKPSIHLHSGAVSRAAEHHGQETLVIYVSKKFRC